MFAKTDDLSLKMVIFVVCIHNYSSDGYTGFRMSSQFSAHPEEKELLLMEGTRVAVMGVEEMMIDVNTKYEPFWKEFNGQKITIVYLFHTT